MYSDLAMLMLRFAQIIAPEMTQNTDAINYYLGQFLYTNTGNYNQFFSKINSDSPFFPFVALRNAEKTNDIVTLEKALKQYPLFVPVINKTFSPNFNKIILYLHTFFKKSHRFTFVNFL